MGACAISLRLHRHSPETEWLDSLAQCKFIFIESTSVLKRLNPLLPSLPLLNKMIAFELSTLAGQAKNPQLISLQALKEIGRRNETRAPKKFEKNLSLLTPDDTYCIHVTAGVSGRPKRIEITHSQMIHTLQNFSELPLDVVKSSKETVFIRGPIRGVELRLLTLGSFAYNWTTAYSKDPNQWIQEIKLIRPTVFFASALELQEIRDYCQTSTKKTLASRLGWKAFSLRKKLGGKLKIIFALEDTVAPKTLDFYARGKVPVLQGYGMIETGPITLNTLRERKAGTSGKPLPSISIKTSGDGEILVKSASLSQENNDGWFETSDLGHVDADGYLHFIERKKEAIRNAEFPRKLISPTKIESILSASPWIHRAAISTTEQGTLIAMVVLKVDQVAEFALNQNVLYSDVDGLIKNPKIQALVQMSIESANLELESHERIHKFVILPHDFSIQKGEIAVSGRLRRKVIDRNFKLIRDQISS
jgi:long-chain acyl-CoA synthetase